MPSPIPTIHAREYNALRSKAHARAKQRLVQAHREEFDRYVEEERRKLGLEPTRAPADDPVARHFGWAEGVPQCPVGEICEHGWVLDADVAAKALSRDGKIDG